MRVSLASSRYLLPSLAYLCQPFVMLLIPFCDARDHFQTRGRGRDLPPSLSPSLSLPLSLSLSPSLPLSLCIYMICIIMHTRTNTHRAAESAPQQQAQQVVTNTPITSYTTTYNSQSTSQFNTTVSHQISQDTVPIQRTILHNTLAPHQYSNVLFCFQPHTFFPQTCSPAKCHNI